MRGGIGQVGVLVVGVVRGDQHVEHDAWVADAHVLARATPQLRQPKRCVRFCPDALQQLGVPCVISFLCCELHCLWEAASALKGHTRAA